MTPSIFEATPEQIAALTDVDLRELIGLLCEQEVSAHGHSTAGVTWGGHQNASDGGIDVRVSLKKTAKIAGYIPRPSTGIQVKAQNMHRAAILNEMAPKGKLLDSIHQLAANSGSYIIASSLSSVSDTSLKKRKAAMKEALKGIDTASNLHIDFYDQRRLTSWVNQHAGLVAWVHKKTGNEISGWSPFGDWSSSPTDTDAEYYISDSVRLLCASIADEDGLSLIDGINLMRSKLHKEKSSIRLVGLSGVGKTRFVQALFDTRVGELPLEPSLVIYTDLSNSPTPTPLDLATKLIIDDQRVILIVDNCGIDLHKKISVLMNNSNARISLVTIEYDIREDEPEHTDVYKLEPASQDLIERILEYRYPEISSPSRSKIAEFADGNARIAFALAETAKKGESLVNLHDTELFNRLFHQNHEVDKDLINAGKICSLLYSFDGETLDGDAAELPILASLAEQSIQTFYQHVAELYRRQLMQKRGNWRAILPHALANRLAKLALEDIPLDLIINNILHHGPIRMIKSFSRRLSYMHDADQARDVAREWLGETGYLGQHESLSNVGEELLKNIAPIDLESTLTYLERQSSKYEKYFSSDNSNKETIISILRSLAYEADYFERCLSLLIRFTHLEKDQNTNNKKACDVVASFFHIYLSGTHASPQQRGNAIRALLQSQLKDDKEMGFSALSAMLKNDHFSTHYQFEFGARSRDYGYHPETNDEITEWYSIPLNIIEDFGSSDNPLCIKTRHIFATQLKWLGRTHQLVQQIMSIAGGFANDSGWPEGWIAIRSVINDRHTKTDPLLLQSLEDLADKLAPKSLQDLIRTYALPPRWGNLDILELEGEETRKEAFKKIRMMNIDLGQQLVQNPTELDAMLAEILHSDSDNILSLGRGLFIGSLSPLELWNKVVTCIKKEQLFNNHPYLLFGFLSEATEKRTDLVETILDSILDDEDLHPFLLYLQNGADISKQGVCRIIKAIEIDSVPTHSFGNLRLGRVTDTIDDNDIFKILDNLSKRPDGIKVCLEIFSMKLHSLNADKIKPNTVQRETGQLLLSKLTFNNKDDFDDYNLGKVIQACLDQEEDEPITQLMCQRMLQHLGAYRLNAWDLNRTFDALIKTHPKVVLDIFVEEADDQQETGRGIFRDLREDKPNALRNLSNEELKEWVNAKPDTRIYQLAKVIHYFDKNDEALEWSSIALWLISQSPDPTKTLDTFMYRFSPMSWSGSRASIMESRLPLLEYFTTHKALEISNWASTKLQILKKQVAEEREFETKRSRNQDERFEY